MRLSAVRLGLRLCLAALGLGCAAAPGPAAAAVISGVYSFTAEGINLAGAVGVPANGAFFVTFDNADDVYTGTDVSAGPANFPITGTVSFDYYAALDMLAVTNFTYGGVTDTFALYINNASTTPSLAYFDWYRPDGTVVETMNGTVAFAVPEPASLALFGTALLGLLAGRRRRPGIA